MAANLSVADWFKEREAFRKGHGAEPEPKSRVSSPGLRGGRGGSVAGRSGRGGFSRHANHGELQTFVIPSVLKRDDDGNQEDLPLPAEHESEKVQG